MIAADCPLEVGYPAVELVQEWDQWGELRLACLYTRPDGPALSQFLQSKRPPPLRAPNVLPSGWTYIDHFSRQAPYRLW